MSRLDTSPQSRLRSLAQNLSLSEHDADHALHQSSGDVQRAEKMLIRNPRARKPALTPEARIEKAASLLGSTPDALDILHASLSKALAQPNCERFRKVNVTAGIFKERVSAKNPAGVELLYAVGYTPMHGHLVLQHHEPKLLEAATAALARTRQCEEYLMAKAASDGATARRESLAREAEAAKARRLAHLVKVPTEPAASDGSSVCVISVRVGAGEKKATRRFDSENTLEDLDHWIRSLEDVPEGEIAVTNVTTRPPRVLDAKLNGMASLYSLDLWPVAHVRVVPLVRVRA